MIGKVWWKIIISLHFNRTTKKTEHNTIVSRFRMNRTKKIQEKIQPYTKKATKRDGAQNITVRHLDRNSVQRKDMLMCMQQFFAYSILS